MAKTRSMVTLRAVSPAIPRNQKERRELEEDLERMGCSGLLQRPWSFKDVQMVAELRAPQSTQYAGSARANPSKWTAKLWRGVYGFLKHGQGICSRKDSFVEGKFAHRPDPKDGYTVADCKSARARRVYEFLVPILHPDRPTRVTTTLANTIWGAYSGRRVVDWGEIFRDLVGKLVHSVGGTRPSPLSPFLYHLYKEQDVLHVAEEDEYEVNLEMIRAGYKRPEPEQRKDDSGEGSQSEDEESDSEATPPPKSSQPSSSRQKRKREQITISPEPATPPPEPEPEAPPPEVPPGRKKTRFSSTDHFDAIIQEAELGKMETAQSLEILDQLCELAGGVPKERLLPWAKRMAGPELQEKIKELTADVTQTVGELKHQKTLRLKLEDDNRVLQLKSQRAEIRAMEAEDKAKQAATSLARIVELVDQPGDVLIKSKLFDEGFQKFEAFSDEDARRIVASMVRYSSRIERVSLECRTVTRMFLGKDEIREQNPTNPESQQKKAEQSGPDPETVKKQGEPSRKGKELVVLSPSKSPGPRRKLTPRFGRESVSPRSPRKDPATGEKSPTGGARTKSPERQGTPGSGRTIRRQLIVDVEESEVDVPAAAQNEEEPEARDTRPE